MTNRQTYDQAFFFKEGPLGLETVKYYNYPDQPFSYRPGEDQGVRDLVFRPGIDSDEIETLEDKNNRTIGYLQEYVDGMRRYEQSGTDIPDFKVRSDYAQEQGGPLVGRTIRYSPPNAILKTPHIDSPYMEQLIERGFKPLTPPKPSGPRGPQLPNFVQERSKFAQMLAANQGPSTPIKYDESMGIFVPNLGAGRATNIRYKGAV